jgi:AraC-like DNA-binding protein
MTNLIHRISQEARQCKLSTIPPDLLELYMERQITSSELAAKVGMNASYLRRALKRAPPVKLSDQKRPLLEARKQYRESISHLSVAEIVKLAHVSVRTAQRIRASRAKLAP